MSELKRSWKFHIIRGCFEFSGKESICFLFTSSVKGKTNIKSCFGFPFRNSLSKMTLKMSYFWKCQKITFNFFFLIFFTLIFLKLEKHVISRTLKNKKGKVENWEWKLKLKTCFQNLYQMESQTHLVICLVNSKILLFQRHFILL